MNSEHPYTHILKNLFHEQAAEIIPILWPGYEVKQVLHFELPELRSTEIEGPPNEMARGIVGLVLPEAEVIKAYKTEWIEHSGKFERLYRVKNNAARSARFLLIEFQTERDAQDLARCLLSHFASALRFVEEDLEPEYTKKKRPKNLCEIYPYALCTFPSAVPARIRNEFDGEVTLEFNFMTLKLWEQDAREILNSHVRATYFLLPAMKNADAELLGLAIEELAQHFGQNEAGLGRHLTGLSLMLHQSELMAEEEKLAVQQHLQPFAHLIKADPIEE